MVRLSALLGYALVCGAGLLRVGVAQNLVTNGGFETVSPPLGMLDPTNYRYLGNGDSTTLAPWTTTNDGIGEPSYAYNFTRYPAEVFEGLNAFDIAQGTSIRQNVSLSVGQYYAYSMYISHYSPTSPNPFPLTVRIGSISFEVRNETAPFLFLRKIFQASEGGSVVLRIENNELPPDYKNYGIDGIQLELAHRVNGHASLNGYLASTTGDFLEVEVWQSDSLVETLDGNYGPGGIFACSPTVSGAAVLRFRFRTGLWKAVPVILGAAPIEDVQVNMTNGDCDHDNEVGIGDYSILSAIYGLSDGDPGYDTNADLNGDGSVDIADYAILSESYGEVGD